MQSQDDNDFCPTAIHSQNHRPVIRYQGFPEFTNEPDPSGEPAIYAHVSINGVMTKTDMLLDPPEGDSFITWDAIYKREEA